MALAIYLLLATVLLAGTVLPFLPVAHGLVRVGDFPRQQYLALALALIAAAPFFAERTAIWLGLLALLAAVAFVQAVLIAEFTPFARKQSTGFDPTRHDGDALRLVAANVKMSNRQRQAMLAELERAEPDILVLMEVDNGWAAALSPLTGLYPHVVSRPQNNSYGMIVASRLELADIALQCLLTKDVPSVVATVRTKAGRRFRLYALHPEPPVPHRGTTGRDGETALVALRVREETLPVIVTGDLNDVAWSKTTRRFRRVSRLLDPRIGRSVFSTFDARIPLLRWPLDHLFHSAEFRLAGMRRLAPCGSDHFPVAFDLVLCSRPETENHPEPADGEDVARARDLVGAARKRDEKPIGGDWET
ncbi:MAG: endonuclease/exonuclease/phosphatase family protein [Nitratireductor sp.]